MGIIFLIACVLQEEEEDSSNHTGELLGSTNQLSQLGTPMRSWYI